MKRPIALFWVCSLWMYADTTQLESITVETNIKTQVIKDVHGEDIKSADLGEALFKQSPSISMVRRSGIANDVIVRGQKKDNINVTIDGTKVYGACPNRMDPPISHVLTNNIDYIEINEGPYNVEDFGVLSADVKVHTLEPTDEFKGDANLAFGSWGYKKLALLASGAIRENVKFLLSASAESSGQYQDGDGNDFAGQIDREIDKGAVPAMVQYQDTYRDMDAYTKKTLLTKLIWNITENQDLTFSYNENQSDEVLYPSSPMDALYDYSTIYNLEYVARDMGRYSKVLALQMYQSEVEHPMSNKYRNSGATNYITHALTTKMQGANIKNSFDIDNHTITTGLDYSLRNWDGVYTTNDEPSTPVYHSIYDVDTENMAFFIKDKMSIDKWVVDMGLRFDTTDITSAYVDQQPNSYNELNGYIFATYNANATTHYFAGVGKSSRVPDAKELYWLGSDASVIGTDTLENTINYEVDMGVKKEYDNATTKAKLFYSKLSNFIAYNASSATNNYENVDATIYGFELSGSYFVTSNIAFDYAMAYQKGEKKNPLRGQTGTNMPEIPPLKLNGSVHYAYDESLNFEAQVIASDAWRHFDEENGEQALDAYALLNLKASKAMGAFVITLGIDNVLDTTYTVSNTYNDLVLLPTVGTNSVTLMNEPGRYLYTNVQYKF